MKRLTIRQPYVHLIFAGLKIDEFRSWKTSYRGPLLIHIGQRRDKDDRLSPRLRAAIPDELPCGGYFGIVDLIDIRETDDTDPAMRYAWRLKNPRLIPFTPALGSLGLLDAPRSLMRYAA